MKIAIVGAGAMGSLFGALVREAGADVWLVDIWQDHVTAINESGLSIEVEGQTRTVHIPAVDRAEPVGLVDAAILFVKSTVTEAAAETCARLTGKRGVVLTLQNGLGNAEILARRIEADRILAGVTSQGATLLGPGAVRHAGGGLTRIGVWAGSSSEPARPLAELFNAAGIETELVEDIKPWIWNKLLINVGINAITALTGIKNGELLDLEVTRKLCRLAVEEAEDLARELGIGVMENAAEHVFEVARATGPNRSSMGQDVDHQRMTEIRLMNGKVAELARERGRPAPVNFALSALIETLQEHYRG
jgi:2-dehydropantoate 2-reductase